MTVRQILYHSAESQPCKTLYVTQNSYKRFDVSLYFSHTGHLSCKHNYTLRRKDLNLLYQFSEAFDFFIFNFFFFFLNERESCCSPG